MLISVSASTWWPVALPATVLGTAALMLAARLAARAAAARLLRRAGLRPGSSAADPQHLGRRCAAVLAAGAGALVATGLAATAAAGAAWLAGAPAALPLAVAGGAVLTALAALAPPRPLGGGGPRDLALAWEWWRWPGAAKRRLAVSVLAELAGRGRRPRDWPETWVRLATAAPDAGRADATACWYGYLWAMDSGAAGVARALLERALRRPGGPGGQPRLLAECVFHVAWVWGDGDLAQALLNLLPSHPVVGLERLRALAAVQLATGDPARAVASAGAWLEATTGPARRRRFQAGVTAALRDWVSALQAEALTRQAAQLAPQARAS